VSLPVLTPGTSLFPPPEPPKGQPASRTLTVRRLAFRLLAPLTATALPVRPLTLEVAPICARRAMRRVSALHGAQRKERGQPSRDRPLQEMTGAGCAKGQPPETEG